MAIKYVLTTNGVINRETGMTIKEPKDKLESKFWNEYLEWKNEGNTPIPEKPGPEYSIENDEWILDQVKVSEISEKKLKAKMSSPEEIVNILIAKGLISESDFE